MKDLFYRLIIYINTADEKDTYYNVAWYMANHIDGIASMRINELADACYVSPATISRFCRALGYENFAHLKQECMSFHSHAKKFNNLIHIPIKIMKDDPKKATQLYVNELTTVLGRLPKVLNWDVIDQVLMEIHDTKNVTFFGTQFSNSAAIHFQTDLLMLEKFTTAFMVGERQLEMAKRMKKGDLAIIVSVNGNYAFSHKTLQYLKKSGCTIVLITCMDKNILNIPPDYTIYIGTPKDGKSGKHSLLALMELMSLRYYALFSPSLEGLEENIVKEV